ncbi:MAG: pyrrolysine--tRNA(Pyl) ligase small subunit [Desulfocucumaceae bacterium]
MSKIAKKYYRKRIDFFKLINKIKLWPSRKGTLHGIRSFTVIGDYAEIVTHCNQKFIVRNSKNCRAARWLRNKWSSEECKKCAIPQWKLEKFSVTFFNQHWGSRLFDTGEK